MSFLFFMLPVLIVAGAFLWLKPSPRDQFLAKLRSGALQQGFKISSLKVPDLSEFGRVNNKYEIVTLYEKGLRLENGSLPQFTVVRTSGECGAYLPEGWAWDKRIHLNEAQYVLIADKLAKLPQSISVVCLMNESVAVSWDEKDPNITFEILNTELSKLALDFNRTPI